MLLSQDSRIGKRNLGIHDRCQPPTVRIYPAKLSLPLRKEIVRLKLPKCLTPKCLTPKCLTPKCLTVVAIPLTSDPNRLNLGDVIVIDNASFHHPQSIVELVERVRWEIGYLRLYSPGLNHIEHPWAGLRIWMRQQKVEFQLFRDAVDATFNHSPDIFP